MMHYGRILCLVLALWGAMAPPAHAYKSTEWVDTGEFEFETADELWTALRWFLWRSVTDPLAATGVTSQALVDGNKVWALSLTLDEAQVHAAIGLWLSTQWYKASVGEVKVTRTKAAYTDSAGQHHYQVALWFPSRPGKAQP